ncbi:MAG: YIP1 family protein [Prolixibacteraceae bacterium]
MNPLFSIWLNPAKTFASLATQDQKKTNRMINWLFFVIPMSAAFSGGREIKGLFEGNYFAGLFVSMILLGIMGFCFGKYILSLSLWACSKLFQGKATKKEMQLVLAYGLIPNLVYLVIGLILIIPAILLDKLELIGYQHPVTLFVLWIFTLRIIIIGLAHFNKYSYGYAILTIFIPVTIFQGLIFGIRYLI